MSDGSGDGDDVGSRICWPEELGKEWRVVDAAGSLLRAVRARPLQPISRYIKKKRELLSLSLGCRAVHAPSQ